MRYLATVEMLAARHQGTPAAEEATAWLAELRRELTPTQSDLEPIETESPVLLWLSRKLDGADYRRIRKQAADYIRRLSPQR